MRGRIIKGIAGFYYVDTGGEVYECKARGLFRRDRRKPLVGDEVEFEAVGAAEKTGNIVRLYERRSCLVRPAVANVEQALVVSAFTKPKISYPLLERFLVQMERQNIPCILAFNKADIVREAEEREVREVYGGSGYPMLSVSAQTGEGMEALEEALRGKITTLAGPSGVGKSSLVNRLQRQVAMETGEISAKIERGRQTTRHVQLIPLEKGGFILDTPGFGSVELYEMRKEEVRVCYPEFAPLAPYCRFAGCAHVNEPDCRVKQAVQEGLVSRIRYENYVRIYQELETRRKY